MHFSQIRFEGSDTRVYDAVSVLLSRPLSKKKAAKKKKTEKICTSSMRFENQR